MNSIYTFTRSKIEDLIWDHLRTSLSDPIGNKLFDTDNIKVIENTWEKIRILETSKNIEEQLKAYNL